MIRTATVIGMMMMRIIACVRACVRAADDARHPLPCALHSALLAISPAPLFFTRAYWPTASDASDLLMLLLTSE